MLFGSRRETPLDPDAIASLTQPFVPDLDRCRALLDGYRALDELGAEESQALPLLIRSRWIQMRLRGARKVAEPRRVAMVLDRFFSVIEWLERDGERFFRELR